MTSLFGDQDDPAAKARQSARQQVRTLVRRVAVDVYGATTVEVPIEGFTVLTDTHLDPPIAGIDAAIFLQRNAERALEEAATAARAAGYSWDEIGQRMGITGEVWADHSPGEVAYSHLVWDQPLPDVAAGQDQWSLRQRSAHWTCRSCEQRITDRGPWDPHPDDVEQGHADACPRHQTDVRAWQERADD